MPPKLYPDLQKLIYPSPETQYSTRYPSLDQFHCQRLYQAIFEGHRGNAALYLSADNIDTSYGDYRITPLHVAAHENQIEIADDLLEEKADATSDEKCFDGAGDHNEMQMAKRYQDYGSAAGISTVKKPTMTDAKNTMAMPRSAKMMIFLPRVIEPSLPIPRTKTNPAITTATKAASAR